MMLYVDDLEEKGKVSFNAGKARKIALTKLYAYLEFRNETEFLKALIDDRLKKYLPEEYRKVKAEDPKVESRQRALDKAA